MNPVEQAKRLVFGYNENPKNFTDEQAEQIAFIAAQLGLPFRPESKALQKFFFDVVDNISFGLLPEDQRPRSRGESVFGETKSEKLAKNLALIGLAVPGMAGAKLATRGAKALKPRLPQATQDRISRMNTNNLLNYATSAGGGLAAMNILEDPYGVPERALTGALLGGGFGVARNFLGMTGASGAIPMPGNTVAARLPGFRGLLQSQNPIRL